MARSLGKQGVWWAMCKQKPNGLMDCELGSGVSLAIRDEGLKYVLISVFFGKISAQ
jgi:hypothetical protein